MATCLVCVKDLVTEGTCNLICDIESEDMTSGELNKLISRGRLIKLKLEYTARVDKACENETLQAYKNTSSTTIWLKRSNSASGAIDVFSQEMLSGKFPFVGYKHIHVSCILKLLTRNYSSQFSIKTSQSVVDVVEQFANRSNTRDEFWTLMPMGKHIYVTFVVSSGNSSVASAKHWEFILSGQLWTKLSLVIYVVSIVVITLCSPVIVLAFRPSEIVGNKNSHLPLPVSESTSQEDATYNHSRRIYYDLSNLPTNEGEQAPMLQSEKYDRTTAEMVSPNAKTSQRSPKPGSSSVSSTSGIHNATTDRSYCKIDFALVKMPTQHDESAVPSAYPALRDGPKSIASRDSDENKHTTEHLVAKTETSGNVRKGGGRTSTESTNEIRMILVGKNPVALESWIGNCLFNNSKKGRNSTKSLDTPKDIARYILCYFSPVLVIIGLGDLSLVLLKYSSSRPDDFPSNCLIASIFTWWRIIMAIVIIFVQCLQSYYARKWAAESSNVWRSCFVHRNHVPIILRLKCFCYPCDECQSSPPDCPTQVDIPNNIVHNSDKVAEGFLKHCNYFAQYVTDFYMTTEFSAVVKVLSVILLLAPLIFVIIAVFVIINFFMDVLLSSPIVCSFQSRIWLLKESLQDRFRVPRFDIVCDILEGLVKLGLFAWLVYYSIYDAIYIINTIVGFITLILKNFPDQVHKHVLVVFFLYYYCFRCYFCFKAYYCKLVQELYKSYMKKYDEIQKATNPIELVNYRQGDYMAIEYELFEFAIHREAIELPRNRVCDLLKKIGGMFLIFAMIYLAISTPVKIEIVFAFFIVYWYADSFINDIKFEQLEIYADPIVDDFIFINKKK